MPYIIALVAGALFHNTGVAVFVIEHIFVVVLLVAVVTAIVAGFRGPPAKRRTPSAPANRPVVITPGAPVPPRRKPHRTPPGGWS
jgi:hypothetical protein